MDAPGTEYVVAALYKFSPLPQCADVQPALAEVCEAAGVVGTLLLAEEGINGTIAGSAKGIEAVLSFLRTLPGFEDLLAKRAYADQSPFHRMKVRLKKEIVTIGDLEIDPTDQVGTYVEPRAFDALLDDPEVLVIDTRNAYEVRLGTFDGAVDPGLDNFRAFPQWVRDNLDPARHKKIAMFCTGGIRCEKASAFMLKEGFEEVYHLFGGILRYLEQTPPDSGRSRWNGECFVFDQRVSVDAHLRVGTHQLCFGCLEPVSEADRASPLYESGVTCPRCANTTSEDDRQRRRERVKQMAIASAQGRAHLGVTQASSTPRPLPAMPDDKVSDPAPDGVLYSFRRCPYAMRARMALAASGLDPEIREVALKAKPAEMLALGSTTVPVMRLADGTVLRESRDIMGWAQSRTPQAMPYRDDGALTALVDAVDGPFKAALDRYKYPDRFADEDTSDARARAVAVLRSIDGLITDAGFLDGEEPGFHDAAVFPFVRQFAGVDAQWFQSLAVDPSGPMPKLVAWWSQMREHPWFGSIMKKLKPWAPQDPPIRFRSTLVS